MSRPSTSRDVQRVTFVESLHASLKKQAAKAIAEHNKFITLTSSYVADGLEDSECIELLMIDGLSREASESYVAMVKTSNEETQDELIDYSFQFEGDDGRILSSYDIGKIVRAANDDDAWIQAEELLCNEDSQKLLSVCRIH
jgi:hypothetical protein